MGSNKFNISSPEVVSVLKNALMFLAPVGLIYFAFVQVNLNANGFSSTDFVPNQVVIGAMLLYVVNVVTDFLRKFVPNTN